VVVDGVTQPTIADADVEGLIARGVATDGMSAKLRAAARAIAAGTKAVRIGDLAILTDPTAGTRIFSARTSAAVHA
jgi:acetylglutamate kinase